MGYLAYLAVTALGGIAVALGGPFIGAAGWLLGFSSAGPIAGSLAALAQSWIGGAVGAGSVFATLQAAAMVSPTP